jgi:hypothetical protein
MKKRRKTEKGEMGPGKAQVTNNAPSGRGV